MTTELTPELALQADLPAIKKHLHIPYVLEEHGLFPADSSPGRLHYHSPFREGDERPSLDVFSQTINNRPEPEARWGDWAEQTNGDVVDLLQRFHPDLTRPAAIDKAREMLAQMLTSGWSGPTISAQHRPVLDVEAVAELAALSRPLAASPSAWPSTVRSRPGLLDVTPPRTTVFLHPQHDAVVFLLWDENGDVQGARFRWEDGSKTALAGSRNILFRLEPPRPEVPVLLCEGETDTLAAWGALHEDYEVLGLLGVGNHPEKVAGDTLAGRTVYIAFDPDSAGLSAREAWSAYLTEQGAQVHTIILPAGRDIASLSPEAIRDLPNHARHIPAPPNNITRTAGSFAATVNKNGDTEPLANWSFAPVSVLRGEGGLRAYRGLLLPHGRMVTLPDHALSTVTKIRNWGAPYQARWYGNDKQLQQLAALLDHEAALLPEGVYTNQVGLAMGGTFVWPGGYEGRAEVVYDPPDHDAYRAARFHLEDGPARRIDVFRALYGLQHPEVMGPILAWLAAAPLRRRFPQFPILSITGGSGTGKTTLTEQTLLVAAGTILATNLSSSTPYGVESFVDGSNGFPVWFDEYRPGARTDAKLRLDQLLRDAYTGQVSLKGGASESNRNLMRAIRTDTPIVVSGEDSFTETSHVDRMILVHLHREEQGDLRRLLRTTTSGYARSYLAFLTDPNPFTGEGAPVDVDPVLTVGGDDGARSRQATNLAILRYGWQLLEEFVTNYGTVDFDFPELSIGRVTRAASEAADHSPVVELLQLCLENISTLRMPAVWTDHEFVYAHPGNLLAQARQFPGVVLPVSNSRALRDLLVETLGGDPSVLARPPALLTGNMNPPMRTVRIPRGRLALTDIEGETGEADPTI